MKTRLAIVAVLVAACSQNPEYQRPAAPVPELWPEATPGNLPASATPTDWRMFFSDPRLQTLIATALEHNRDMRIAIARVDEARAQYGVVKADRLPTVNLAASRAASVTPGDLAGTVSPTSGQRYDISESALSFEIDFWGRVASLTEAARASYLASEEAKRALRLALISDVANTYFTLIEMEERTALARTTVQLRYQTRAVIERSRDLGAATRLDFLQADSALESARSDLAGFERQRAAASNALNLLVGDVPRELPAGRSIAQQEVNADFATGLPSEMLLKRPDVIAAEQRLIAAHANIGAARAAFLPKMLLTAGLGVASKSLAGLFALGSRAWNFQPSITQPLFDSGRNAANLDIAVARENIAVADYEKTIQQAFREVADLLSARSTLMDQRRATEANLKMQEERVRIARTLNATGFAGSLEVIDAMRELLSAQHTLIQINRAQLSTAAQFYKALGGGS